MAQVIHPQPSILKRATTKLSRTFFGKPNQTKEKEKGHMESVEAYQLKWEEINKILLDFFPKGDFSPKLVSMADPSPASKQTKLTLNQRGDKWVFYVPKPLNHVRNVNLFSSNSDS